MHGKRMLAARSALAEAKFVALCTALKLAGGERVAKKLFAGWKVSATAYAVTVQCRLYYCLVAYC